MGLIQMKHARSLPNYDSLEFGEYLKKDSNLGALIILFSISGLSLLEIFQGNTINFAILLFFAIASIIYLMQKRAQFANLKTLPIRTGVFNPFSSTIDNHNEPSYYGRPEAEDLLTYIGKNEGKCVVLVGDSGVGKSVLLDPLLRDMCLAKNIGFLKIDEYLHPVVEICDFISKIEQLPNHTNDIWMSLRTSIDNGYPPSEEVITVCLDTLSELPPTIFVFDQSERLLLSVPDETAKDADRVQIYLLGRILKAFIQCRNITPIFAIRGDTFFKSMQGMINLIPSISSTDDVNSKFQYWYLYGISSDQRSNSKQDHSSPDVIGFLSDVTQARSKLSKESSKQLNTENFLKSIAFFDKTRANTFISKIAGFMVENFYDHDQRVQKAALSSEDQQENYLNIFLQYIIQGFIRKHGYTRKSVIEVTLYTLARYNNNRGKPADKKTLSAISHFPQEYVSEAVDYLERYSIIKLGRHNEYRVIHDIISREVLRSDVLKLDNGLKSSIDYLCEHDVSDDQLVIQPQPAYQLVGLDLFKRQEIIWSRAFLFLLAFIGIWRIAFPESLYEALEGYHSLVRRLDPSLIQTFDFNGLYALPYVVTLLVYAVFVHYITYGYLTHVVEGRFWRVFMHSILPLGGGFGAINVFVPVMLVTPIFICGIMVVIMFLVVSGQRNVVGDARKESLSYAGRTALNISFAWVILTAILAQVVLNYECVFWFAETWPIGRGMIILIVLLATASVLLWGVLHIRSEQASQEAWSRRFALITQSLVVERRRQGDAA